MRRWLAMVLMLTSVLVAPVTGGAIEENPTTGAAWGTVLDQITQRPVPYVCVDVKDGQGNATEHSGFTDHNGIFEIPGMAPGDYTLEIWACETTGYDPTSVGVTVVAGQATEANAVMARSAGFGSITGFVHDAETLESAADVCVKLFLAADDIIVAETKTAIDGGYQFNVEPGEYRVKFYSCVDDRFELQWYDGAEGWSDSTSVTVTAGATTTGVDAAMVPLPEPQTAVVWGYVVDGVTADGVEGYCVSVYHGESKVKTVLTGPEGGYEMEIDAGVETRFKAWPCEGHADLGIVWYPNALEFAGAEVVLLEPGSVDQLETIVVGDIKFSDSVDNLFHGDIIWLAEEGITTGCNSDQTLFCPGEHVTRAHMAAFLHRALGDLLEAGEPVEFTDDDGSQFEADIEWLASVGITTGCNADKTEFCPNDYLTRAQMAAFLHRALGEILAGEGSFEFTDDDGSQFEADIEWLASVGITTGCNADKTEFCPNDRVTRAHMAAFLHRALGTP